MRRKVPLGLGGALSGGGFKNLHGFQDHMPALDVSRSAAPANGFHRQKALNRSFDFGKQTLDQFGALLYRR